VNGETGIAVAIDREGRLEVAIEGRHELVETGDVTAG
jgi:hypothetical protein